MKTTCRLTLFLAICTAGATAAMSADPKPASRNVVLVTADGVRWQEVFRGAEEKLLNETQGQVASTIAALLGENCLADVPNAAKPITDAIAPNGKMPVNPSAAVPLRRIAFGSCATQARPQPIWDAVVATHPDLTLLLGDNIYADTLDMNVMRAQIRQARRHTEASSCCT